MVNPVVILNPILVLCFCTITLKHPSPEVNPATQSGSLISCPSTKGLGYSLRLGKAVFNWSDKPKETSPDSCEVVIWDKLDEALMATIFSNPSGVKCSLAIKIYTTLLKRR